MIDEDSGEPPTFQQEPIASEDAPRRVYIVDDNSDIRRSLHFSLGTVNIVAWPFVGAQDFLDAAASLTPAPLLLDIKMPGIDGIEALTFLREQGINWPTIMMSAHGDISIAVKAMQLGAVDFLEKPFKFEDLVELLDTAYDNLAQTGEGKFSKRDAEELLARMSPREAEIIERLVQGDANKKVAGDLGLSVRTVEVHRANAMAKIGVKSLPQILALMFAAKGRALS